MWKVANSLISIASRILTVTHVRARKAPTEDTGRSDAFYMLHDTHDRATMGRPRIAKMLERSGPMEKTKQ